MDVGERLEALLEEGGRYFMGKSRLHLAAEALARHFEEAGIDYAIAGALCLGSHGFARFTEDVDVLIRREDLERFKQQWLGRGYVNLRPGGKAIRDTHHDVKIDFLVTGDFPGDGKPKPVSFPDPGKAGVPAGRYRILDLAKMVEIKLASGMSAPHRMKDLSDVLELIRAVSLPESLADTLDPSVRGKYLELWQAAQASEPE